MKSSNLRIYKRIAIPASSHSCQTASTAPRFRHLHSTALNTLYNTGRHHAQRPVTTIGTSERKTQGPIAYSLARFASTQAASQVSRPGATTTSTSTASSSSPAPTSTAADESVENVEKELERVEQGFRRLMTSRHVPSEESIIGFMKECEKLVQLAMSAKSLSAATTVSFLPGGASTSTAAQNSHGAVTSSLLDLDSEKASARNQLKRPEPLKITRPALQVRVVSRVSPMLNSLLRDSKVFISEEVLRLYTELQCEMRQAEHFPEMFKLFATKPIPMQQSKQSKTSSSSSSSSSSSPTPGPKSVTTDIKYTPNSPDSAKSAIPTDLANRALDIAIQQRNLDLALAIIDSSFCTKAFKHAKIVRHAGIPTFLALSAPPGAWMAGKYASTFTIAMDPNTATWIGFSAVLAYLTFTGVIGFVAIATANDQMKRVVWMPGTPLRERWLREEERGALDRIACAWGFKDVARMGEEEGEEWDALREIIGLRGMILDKSDLMDGME